jgi:hypothetical protein
MTFLETKELLGHPAAGLLRKKQAAFLLAFLHAAFKQTGLVQVENEVLRARLADWLQRHRDDGDFEEGEGGKEARSYLEEWCSERCGWLRRTLPPVTEVPVFELTAATEKALAWLESLRGREFVGTESRMESIFHQIEALLLDSSEDVEVRLAALRERRDAAEREIEEIERTGRLVTLDPRQVRERFFRLLEEARTLMSEFRQVEENFREVARMVVERQTDRAVSRGDIVGGVLDSHDELRDSPQGQSFYGFVRLLLDPERREKFEEQAARVQELPHLVPEDRENQILLRLLPALRKEQDKVGDSTRRLASNLRRALESTQLAERRRIRELVGEVQQAALRVKARGIPTGDFLTVMEMPDVWPGMSRPLWDAPLALKSSGLEAGAVPEISAELLADLGNLAHLSLEKLREQVEACLLENAWVPLRRVLERFPPEHGLLEVLGYLVVASRSPERHHLPWDDLEVLEVSGARWRVPAVTFGRAAPAGSTEAE